MNIFIRELKRGFRSFLLWAAGLTFLVLAGMVKFSGMSATQTGGMNDMLRSMPKAVLALFGMAEGNIETLGGYYGVLEFYAMVVIACYGVSLGTNAVLRESMDKTYEFLFTKPRGRLAILGSKLTVGLMYLTALCAVNWGCSRIAPGLYGLENTIASEMGLYALAVGLVGLMFYCGSVFLSTVAPRGEQGVKCSWALVLISYGLSVVFDMDEKLEFLRPVTLFRYFRLGELLEGNLHGGYAMVTVVCSGVLLIAAGICFREKDLAAV